MGHAWDFFFENLKCPLNGKIIDIIIGEMYHDFVVNHKGPVINYKEGNGGENGDRGFELILHSGDQGLENCIV